MQGDAFVTRFDVARSRVHGEEGSADAPQGHATSRRIESLIRRLIHERTQQDVADAMRVDPSALTRYLSGECGIPIDRLDLLFVALGLRVIEHEDLRFLKRRAAERLLDDEL